jgi:FAD/FMN-containing dehydrogenase
VSRLVHDLVTAAGGSISAEHGIGQMKRDELARLDPARVAHLHAIKAGLDPVRVARLKAIKTALDPAGIMNPGKLV